LISNNPHLVPTSLSYISSVLFTIVAPDTLAIRLLSVFLTRLMTDTSSFSK